MNIDFKKLREPFQLDEIEWRIQSAGAKKSGGVWARVLAYVTSRAIQNRLDDVCGPENWKNEFTSGPDGGILCGISIKVNGEWITKWDGADKTQIEAVKGGLSGAVKRAGVQWGIGRYLYGVEEGYAVISDKGAYYQGPNSKKGLPAFKWSPPALPMWALPSNLTSPNKQPDEHPQSLDRPVPKDNVGNKIIPVASQKQVGLVNGLIIKAYPDLKNDKPRKIAKMNEWLNKKYGGKMPLLKESTKELTAQAAHDFIEQMGEK